MSKKSAANPAVANLPRSPEQDLFAPQPGEPGKCGSYLLPRVTSHPRSAVALDGMSDTESELDSSRFSFPLFPHARLGEPATSAQAKHRRKVSTARAERLVTTTHQNAAKSPAGRKTDDQLGLDSGPVPCAAPRLTHRLTTTRTTARPDSIPIQEDFLTRPAGLLATMEPGNAATVSARSLARSTRASKPKADGAGNALSAARSKSRVPRTSAPGALSKATVTDRSGAAAGFTTSHPEGLQNSATASPGIVPSTCPQLAPPANGLPTAFATHSDSTGSNVHVRSLAATSCEDQIDPFGWRQSAAGSKTTDEHSNYSLARANGTEPESSGSTVDCRRLAALSCEHAIDPFGWRFCAEDSQTLDDVLNHYLDPADELDEHYPLEISDSQPAVPAAETSESQPVEGEAPTDEREQPTAIKAWIFSSRPEDYDENGMRDAVFERILRDVNARRALAGEPEVPKTAISTLFPITGPRRR